MQNSKAYDYLIKQMNTNGSEKMDGYYPRVMEEIYRLSESLSLYSSGF